MPVAEALSSLAEALLRSDVPVWQRPPDTRAIDDLRAVLAPLVIPDDLATFWTEVDISTLNVGTYPQFTDAGYARESWVERRELFAEGQPLALVDVGYESHAVMSVELGTEHGPGGSVHLWGVDDDVILRRYDGLGDWLAEITSYLDAGSFRRGRGANGAPWLWVDLDPDLESTAPAQPSDDDGMPADDDGRARYVGFDAWPQHWQQLNRALAPHLFPSPPDQRV